ncbi:MAG: hypothetical protein IT258_02785, partial [Saprospiraceae bacterium]|nr:hypothetical protein [Saprospiraceae bacterium]
MKWPLFENKIRKSLRSHQSEVDADAIWAAIEPQVDAMNRRKKRRFILFWFLLPGLLLSGMVFYVFYENNLGLNTVEKSVNTDASIENAMPAQAVLNNKKSVSGTALDEDCEDANTATSNQEGEITAAQKTVINTSVFKRKLAVTHGRNQLKGTLNSDILIAGNGSQASQATLNEPIAEQPQTAVVPSPLAGSFNQLLLPYPPIAPFAANTAEPKAKAVAQTVEMTPLRKRDFQWTGAVQASISFLDREMAATDSSFTALLDLRERYERQLEAVQVGIRFGLEHRSGLSLNTGLNYAQLNEVYKNNYTVTTVDTMVYGIQYYYVNFEEDTIPVYGDI